MAKKHEIDLRAELRKRVKEVKALAFSLQEELRGCVNERAHLKQFYAGRIVQVEAELDYLSGLLDG
jgi:hypothetical protein